MGATGLSGKSVIVTGAASGIGRATALRFAEEGAKVVVADLNEEGAKGVVAAIESEGGTAVAVTGDLSDGAVADAVVAAAVGTFGGVDVLVNNAGVMDSMSAAADVTDAEWERVLRINLTAPFLLTRAVLPHMIAAGGGAIVNTASEASLRGSAAGTAYTVSKHGVLGLTRSLAVMYRDQGIRTNAIAPGGTATDITADVRIDAEAHGPSVVGRHFVNMGRICAPEEQAAAIVYLASDAASGVNGVVLPVDNAWAAV
ncbi:SDR family NAD(P)-dependent oxidoreductase [Streptomyces koelreuteriae]|uniref:SDR family NAD(P)-dependent oxidoreductase n=1 Tax=Streptomyces koelreuteriae TaxID=2838015 RepID=UPI003EBEDB16